MNLNNFKTARFIIGPILLLCSVLLFSVTRSIKFTSLASKTKSTIRIKGSDVMRTADYDNHLRITIEHPEKATSCESFNITMRVHHWIYPAEGWSDYEASATLHASSFEISPKSTIVRNIKNNVSSQWSWNLSPKPDRINKQRILLAWEGLDIDAYLQTTPGPLGAQYSFSVEKNGKLLTNYSHFRSGEIPIDIFILSKYGIPISIVWIIQASLGLIGFIFTCPLIIKWLISRRARIH